MKANNLYHILTDKLTNSEKKLCTVYLCTVKVMSTNYTQGESSFELSANHFPVIVKISLKINPVLCRRIDYENFKTERQSKALPEKFNCYRSYCIFIMKSKKEIRTIA